MSRLTMRCEHFIDLTARPKTNCSEICNRSNDCEKCIVNEAFKKLADYEDKEEQGLLIELPCKVGDTFWELSWSEVDRTAYPRVAHSLQHCCYVKDKLGTWCFLTKAEAEEALARMKVEALAKMGGTHE